MRSKLAFHTGFVGDALNLLVHIRVSNWLVAVAAGGEEKVIHAAIVQFQIEGDDLSDGVVDVDVPVGLTLPVSGLGFQPGRNLVEELTGTVHEIAESQLTQVGVAEPHICTDDEQHVILVAMDALEIGTDGAELIAFEGGNSPILLGDVSLFDWDRSTVC